ncbi:MULTISPECIES: ABC transporter permease [unclassified Helicobacter]|uniref:ABC transporter permease n=1 Tax=unclassified Helicobacter TaxID=2593540 RepID=UPI000CF0A870|nr:MULTISPECIES: ABC transporter permease [unclassified Helicobacter]
MPPLFWALFRNKFLWIVYLAMPILLGGIIYSIFIDALPRKLPIGVVDFDKSTLSRELIYDMQASPTFSLNRYYTSISEAKRDLSDGHIYAIAVIPDGLQRGVKLGIEQKIALYYNTQFILIGKALDSAFLQVVSILNAKIQTGNNLVKTKNMSMAMGASLPILPHIDPLFNTQSSYAQFLVTLILPCMWQILVALGLLNLLSYPIRDSVDLWMRFCFNLFIFTFWGMVMVFFFDFLGYPLVGNVPFLFFGFLLLGLCISGIVLTLQGAYQNPTKAIGLIAAYTAPSLAFAGVTYPQSAMDNFAVFWSNILPISYFMKFYFQQANYGGSIMEGLKILIQMTPFLLFIPLGFLLYRLKGKI